MAEGSRGTTLTTILVAIIAVIGGISPFFATTLYNQILNKPLVNIDIMAEPYRNNAVVEVTNRGIAPATNVSLTIDANTKILNVRNVFSNTDVNITFPEVDDTLLEIKKTRIINNPVLALYTPKLIHGEGSRIRTETSLDLDSYKKEQNTTYDYDELYKVFATYDQGSSLGHPRSYFEDIFEEQYGPLLGPLLGPLIVAFVNPYFLIIFYIFYVFIIAFPVRRYLIRRRRKKLADKIHNEIINIRANLKDPKSQATFPNRKFLKAKNINYPFFYENVQFED